MLPTASSTSNLPARWPRAANVMTASAAIHARCLRLASPPESHTSATPHANVSEPARSPASIGSIAWKRSNRSVRAGVIAERMSTMPTTSAPNAITTGGSTATDVNRRSTLPTVPAWS